MQYATHRFLYVWYILTVALVFSVIAVALYARHASRIVFEEIQSQREQFVLLNAQQQASTTELSLRIETLQSENTALIAVLDTEREAAKTLEQSVREQVRTMSSTVESLDTLSKRDPELLKKYSKTYFLNEHYVPAQLIEIPTTFTIDDERTRLFHQEAWPYLERLLEAAESSEVPLRIASAYRSFAEQGALKGAYTRRYGTGANQFSADQGYSEHQLGTAVDVTTPTLGSSFTSFGSTAAYQWMKDNAHQYGFILSYPENNQYYQYEPWHWRFVGVDLATRLHREGKAFYEADQRMIDAYLLVMFQ